MRKFCELLLLISICAVPADLFSLAASAPRTIVEEDFSHGMDNWWVEGGQRVWVEDGRLHVRAEGTRSTGGEVATVWCKTPHPASFQLEMNAHVVSSSMDVNNINLFFNYSDPSGKPLYETRNDRKSGAYDLYHQLNGYILTFLRADQPGARSPDGTVQGRVRFRRDPGFRLLAQNYTGDCRAGVTYRLRVAVHDGEITFWVDGKQRLSTRDPKPLGGGYFGLRTYRTYLWWDHVKLSASE